MGSFSAGLGTFTTLIQVNVILAGVILIAKGSVDISDLVTFLLYISVFTEPVRTLIDFTEQFQNGYTGFERFQEIMAIGVIVLCGSPSVSAKINAASSV